MFPENLTCEKQISCINNYIYIHQFLLVSTTLLTILQNLLRYLFKILLIEHLILKMLLNFCFWHIWNISCTLHFFLCIQTNKSLYNFKFRLISVQIFCTLHPRKLNFVHLPLYLQISHIIKYWNKTSWDRKRGIILNIPSDLKNSLTYLDIAHYNNKF